MLRNVSARMERDRVGMGELCESRPELSTKAD